MTSLGEWPTLEPPVDFASRVAELALEEPVLDEAALGDEAIEFGEPAVFDEPVERSGRRRVVVPLVLAAALVSLGAAAGWGRSRAAQTVGSAETAETAETPTKQHLLRSSPVRGGQAPSEIEPEQIDLDSTDTSKKRGADSEDDDEAAPRPAYHHPACSCGPGAVVCSCYD